MAEHETTRSAKMTPGVAAPVRAIGVSRDWGATPWSCRPYAGSFRADNLANPLSTASLRPAPLAAETGKLPPAPMTWELRRVTNYELQVTNY